VSRVCAALVVLWVSALAGASHAFPISYGFSARATALFAPGVPVETLAAAERSYLDAHPGEATPGWDGMLSYDADTGDLTLSLIAPLSAGTAHVVDLGGTAAPAFAGDLDVLSVTFPNAATGLRVFEMFATDDLYLWGGTSTLVLAGQGLISGGALAPGLTLADLSDAYLYLFPASLDSPSTMRTFGCPAELTLLDCAYAGYQIYLNDSSTLVVSFAELHAIPEPSVSLYFCLALFLFSAARSLAARSR
jgi:hypothetical protein